MKKLKCGIYRIRNLINNDCYIGQSVNLKQRKYFHFYYLKDNKSRHPILQNACNKYGIENFIFEIILYCNKENLTYYEQICVDKFNPKYNCLKLCVDSPRGIIKPKKIVDKMKYAQRLRNINAYRIQYPELHEKFIINNNNLTDEEEYLLFRKTKLKIRAERYNRPLGYVLFDNQYPQNVDINITKNELLAIKKFSDYKYQKLLFAFLTLSKYYFLIGETDDYIFHKKISSIFGFSKVHVGKKKSKKIIDNLINFGYITKTVNYYKVNFIDNVSNVEISTNNILEIMDLLPSYCEICGKPMKKNSSNHRFCEECYYIRQKEQNRIKQYAYRHM